MTSLMSAWLIVVNSLSKPYLLMGLLLIPTWSWAVIDGHKYPFDSVEDTERFEQLAEDLRCPKCQNQNLADSDAPVAADLRDKVYQLLLEGKSDEQVVDYLVARYGDFVRYNPPFRLDTLLLWLSPILLLLVGAVLIRSVMKQQPNQTNAPLTQAEQQRLADLLTTSDPTDSATESVSQSTDKK